MLERLFHLQQSATDVRTEVLGGVTTFMTMAYIVFVNPAVLSQTGMDFGAVMTATCLSAGIATWIMGLAANYPIALAPAMGENFFFLTVVLGMGLPWRVALAAVFVSGVVFFLLTFLRIRELIIDAVPASLKHSIAVGIGMFVALIGLTNAGIVERPETGFLHLGDLGRAPTLVALAGLLLTVGLMAWRVRGAVLLGILFATLVAWVSGLVEWHGLVAAPPSMAPTFLQLDLAGLLDASVIPVVIIFLFMAVFDAIGTLIGIGQQGGFLDANGRLPRATRALMADSSGTVLGSLMGTSTVTAYVESATGVEAGARTGLANMVTGALFFLAVFFEPVVRMVGGGVPVDGGTILQPMTAPALIVVGSLMARNVVHVRWSDITEGFPAFLVVVGIPFSWSIADGIAFGFIAYPALKLMSGRPREASPLVYALGLIFVLRYALL
jgi:AGZA family xanthine/uracil permease-like MFS transporter